MSDTEFKGGGGGGGVQLDEENEWTETQTFNPSGNNAIVIPIGKRLSFGGPYFNSDLSNRLYLSIGGAHVKFYATSYTEFMRKVYVNDAIKSNAIADPTTVVNRVSWYAKDVGGDAEAFVKDEAENVTQLSAHDKFGFWHHNEVNKEGIFLDVNQLLINLLLEKKLNKFRLKKFNLIILKDKNGNDINKRKFIKMLKKLYSKKNIIKQYEEVKTYERSLENRFRGYWG